MAIAFVSKTSLNFFKMRFFSFSFIVAQRSRSCRYKKSITLIKNIYANLVGKLVQISDQIAFNSLQEMKIFVFDKLIHHEK